MLVFADGAATREGIGIAAVVLLPLGYDETDVEDSVTFSAPILAATTWKLNPYS